MIRPQVARPPHTGGKVGSEFET